MLLTLQGNLLGTGGGHDCSLLVLGLVHLGAVKSGRRDLLHRNLASQSSTGGRAAFFAGGLTAEMLFQCAPLW